MSSSRLQNRWMPLLLLVCAMGLVCSCAQRVERPVEEKLERKKTVSPSEPDTGNGLSPEEQTTLLQIARESLAACVAGKRPPELPQLEGNLAEIRGAFVTLKKDGNLRGCIGTFRATTALAETVQSMARAAALEDPRFPSVTTDEAAALHIEISALTPMMRIDDPMRQVEVGTHGLYIRKGFNSGTLLPQVATEQGWDRKAFLQHTCRKAGLPTDAWKAPDAEVYVYEAQVFGEEE